MLLLIPFSASAQGNVPAPEFAVASNFQHLMARQLSEKCDGLAFDHYGFDRHILALLAKYSDRGITVRQPKDRYAPIHPSRYDRHVAAFSDKYGLTDDSTLDEFCEAGRQEAVARTIIGQMLQVKSDP